MGKIIYISNKFNFRTGANKSASDVLFSLIKSGHQIIVLTTSSKKNLDPYLFSNNLVEKVIWKRVGRVNNFPGFSGVKQLLKWAYFLVYNGLISKTRLITNKSDLLIANSIDGHNLAQKVLPDPSVMSWAGFRAPMVKVRGALATHSMTWFSSK